MREIDLHNHTVDEAMKFMIECFKEEWKKGKKVIKVIHGYGSGGKGGKIKKSVREYLNKNSKIFKYDTGEGIELNQGYTIIYINGSIEDTKYLIEDNLIEFCTTPKTRDKIIGEFRKYGEKEIMLLITKVIRSGRLKEVIKGKYKCYEKV